MAQPGREDERGPVRQCLAGGERLPKSLLLRFVATPDQKVIFDATGNLPGRGAWLLAEPARLQQALKKRLLQKKLEAQVADGEALAAMVRQGLERQLLSQLGLARKAGVLTLGQEKAEGLLKRGQAGLVIIASDASPQQRERLEGQTHAVPMIDMLGREALSQALGGENTVYLAVKSDIVPPALHRAAWRLACFARGAQAVWHWLPPDAASFISGHGAVAAPEVS